MPLFLIDLLVEQLNGLVAVGAGFQFEKAAEDFLRAWLHLAANLIFKHGRENREEQ